MSEIFQELTAKHIEFIRAQKIFFVATAPNDLENEHVNLSPKGYDTLTVLDDKTVAYADYPGSGNETATHIRQNGRLTMAFMSFDKSPLILRLYGAGEAIPPDSPEGRELALKMEDRVSPYIRQLILLRIKKVLASCGYAVPLYQYAGDRKSLLRWCQKAAISGKIRKYMGLLGLKKN